MKIINPGCRADYSAQCIADFSDTILCPASECQIGSDNISHNLFPCRDGKYCIWHGLVCDGHAQCEDESGKEISSILTNHS